MTSEASHNGHKINQRLFSAPNGAVLTLAWLKSQGISQKLATHNVKSDWLHRVGEGAFTVKPSAQRSISGIRATCSMSMSCCGMCEEDYSFILSY
jgi:hypothetical protein